MARSLATSEGSSNETGSLPRRRARAWWLRDPRLGPADRGDGLAALGESTRVGALVVTPQALVEDSRCPINVRCVWAGRLVLKTRIDGAGWRETVDLTLGQPYATHGTGLALVSAEPGKMAGATPSPPASLFSFEPR